jgi:hypothetical protein
MPAYPLGDPLDPESQRPFTELACPRGLTLVTLYDLGKEPGGRDDVIDGGLNVGCVKRTSAHTDKIIVPYPPIFPARFAAYQPQVRVYLDLATMRTGVMI